MEGTRISIPKDVREEVEKLSMKKKIGTKLAACLLLASLLTGCGKAGSVSFGGQGESGAAHLAETSKENPEDTSKETSEEASKETPEETVTPVGEEYVMEIEVSREPGGVVKAVQYVFAMDTEMMLEAFGERAEEAVRAATQEVLRIDQLLSVGISTSDIARLNAEGSGEVSARTANLLRAGMEIGEGVGGAFDITVYPLMEAWGFTGGGFRVPGEEELRSLLSYVGLDKLSITGNKVTLSEGAKVDLGGIAKGYTSGRLMEIFADYGVDAALVSLGGNVQTYGRKTNGADWNVAIQNPDKDADYLGILACHDVAVVTSGGYERFFEEGGRTYHHILDPKTGYPANAGLRSVTVVSGDGTLADALSTALYVIGPEKAIAYWRQHPGEFGFILLRDDGTILVTEDLAKAFSSKMKVEVVAKE